MLFKNLDIGISASATVLESASAFKCKYCLYRIQIAARVKNHVIFSKFATIDEGLQLCQKKMKKISRGSFIQYKRKMFRKTNIFYPPPPPRDTRTYQGIRNASFWKMLPKY